MRKRVGVGLLCLLVAACGPTTRVRVERQTVCDGTRCETVETATQGPTAAGVAWQVTDTLLGLLLIGAVVAR